MKSYDEIVQSIHKRNKSLIDSFRGSLKRGGLGESTINKHIDNISFFLNEYVTYQDISQNDNETVLCHAEDGIGLVDDFLGYWFIRKAMWSNENSIKSNIISIKKFYSFMQSLNLISKDDLQILQKEIKDYKSEWIDAVNRYNDLEEDFSNY